MSLDSVIGSLITGIWNQCYVIWKSNLVDMDKGPDLSYAGFLVGAESHYKYLWKKETEGRLDTHKAWGRPFKCQDRLR